MGIFTPNEIAKSEQAFTQALKIRRVALGPDHLETGKTIVGLALCLARQQELKPARRHYLAALKIYEMHPDRGPHHKETKQIEKVIESIQHLLDNRLERERHYAKLITAQRADDERKRKRYATKK